jgi:hypothetical protein
MTVGSITIVQNYLALSGRLHTSISTTQGCGAYAPYPGLVCSGHSGRKNVQTQGHSLRNAAEILSDDAKKQICNVLP